MGVAQKRPETQYRTRHARSLWLLGSIVLLWLVGVAFLANAWVIGIILAVPGLFALALCARQALKGRWGSATAWAGAASAARPSWHLRPGQYPSARVHRHRWVRLRPHGAKLRSASRPGHGPCSVLVTFMAVGIITLRLLAIERETHS
jgi:hypothetical protein